MGNNTREAFERNKTIKLVKATVDDITGKSFFPFRSVISVDFAHSRASDRFQNTSPSNSVSVYTVEQTEL